MRVDFEDGATFRRDETINFIFGVTATQVVINEDEPPVEFVVRFLATHEETEESLGADVAPGEIIAVQIPASEFPALGAYRWKLSVISERFAETCIQTGQFKVIEAAFPELTDVVSADE